MQRVYIFGAHSRAQTLAVYLQCLYPGLEVEAFLYDNEEENPGQVRGIPVIHVRDAVALYTEYPVYIGTRGIYHERIAGLLGGLGFQEIHPVTAALDRQLRNAYLEKYFAGIRRDYVRIDDLEPLADPGPRTGSPAVTCPGRRPRAAVYVVKTVYDSPLKTSYAPEPYEKTIQAGAALASRRLTDASATDNEGDNISARNGQFCELTALYWIWKHAPEEVVGLAHYRRHFMLPDDWLARMEDNHVDVILPAPLYVGPSVAENYRKRHDSSDWDCMMEYLRKRDLQECAMAEQFFEGNLYCPCNMFIMRRSVLAELCEWLFPVLFAVAQQGGIRDDSYRNRYPGFLSERMLSFFFEKNRDRYKVVYADKSFLE